MIRHRDARTRRRTRWLPASASAAALIVSACSAVPGGNAPAAAGNGEQVAVVLSGGRWTLDVDGMAGARRAGPVVVSCTSPTQCLAVGTNRTQTVFA